MALKFSLQKESTFIFVQSERGTKLKAFSREIASRNNRSTPMLRKGMFLAYCAPIIKELNGRLLKAYPGSVFEPEYRMRALSLGRLSCIVKFVRSALEDRQFEDACCLGKTGKRTYISVGPSPAV